MTINDMNSPRGITQIHIFDKKLAYMKSINLEYNCAVNIISNTIISDCDG